RPRRLPTGPRPGDRRRSRPPRRGPGRRPRPRRRSSRRRSPASSARAAAWATTSTATSAGAAGRRWPRWCRPAPPGGAGCSRARPPGAGERHAPVRPVAAGPLLRSFVVTLLVVLLAGGLLAYAAVPNFRQAVNTRVDTLVTQVRRQLGAGIVEVHPTGARASS